MIFILIPLIAKFAGLLHAWPEVLLWCMTLLFFCAGLTHFTQARHDFAKMIPPAVPQKMFVVYLTGVLEIIGGVALQIPFLRRAAALALILFLIAVFPANYYAARSGIRFLGKYHLPVLERGLIQVVFILVLYFAAFA